MFCVVTLLAGCDLGDRSVGEEKTTDGDEWDPCAGKQCGEPCADCPPDDPECVVPAVETVCDMNGSCLVSPEDLVCEGEDGDSGGDQYAPCADRQCGDVCTLCDPADMDCVEPTVINVCDPQGACVMETEEPLCEPYDSCADKVCGDPCTQCDPADPDCDETAQEKACNLYGSCVVDIGESLCEPYEPCAGMMCGDPCTQCDPADPQCTQTGEEKACDPMGMCVSLIPELCA